MPRLGESKRRKGERRPWGLAAVAALLAVAASRAVVWRSLGTEPAYVRHDRVRSEAEQPEKRTTDYEPSDWALRPVAFVYLGVLALLVVCCLVLIAAYPMSLPDVARDLRISPPGPHLQTNAYADLQQFRASEQKRLDTYYWVDKQKGIVHVPIEQAMKKLAATGIAGFPKERK